jgi:S1-C subfamily serine protease
MFPTMTFKGRKRHRMRKGLIRRIYVLAIIIPILALACSLQAPRAIPSPVATYAPPPEPETVPLISLPEGTTNEEAVLIELYHRVNPSVVSITVYSNQGGQVTSSGQGSGFVYDQYGHVITNAHVVYGADEVDVTFSDNSVRRAKVIGEDLHSDLAVIEVEKMLPEVMPLPFGDIRDVAVGQTVVAIGNPFGLGGSLTRGVVSALGRNIPALSNFSIPQSIQTDAPINPGNSGGPLLNLKGEVIGVNAQIETSGGSRVNSGIGFAIPVSILTRVIPDLIQNGEHTWGWLGVLGGSLSPDVIEVMELPVEKGAYISGIVSGGPAERAGLRGSSDQTINQGRQVEIGGDVITAIDGQPVSSFEDMLIYIALKANPGQEVTLTIIRDGKTKEVKLTLDERPTETPNTFFNP